MENYLEELQHEEELEKEILCRWEIGIDLYWDKTHLPEQQIASGTNSIGKTI
jgi:TatD DNase family protein